jgi:hypothetical protein
LKVLLIADPVGIALRIPPLADPSRFHGAERWRPEGYPDELTVKMVRETDGAKLFLVQGYQLKASDGLEVLALATLDRFTAGRPFEETLDAARMSDGLPVIPWGFGKWLGARGNRVRLAIRSSDASDIFIGDNSGRPALGRPPGIFKDASKAGIHILPGSDPLPIPGEEQKLGRYGFLMGSGIDPRSPGGSLKTELRGLNQQPTIVGRREGLMGFFRTQLRRRFFSPGGTGLTERTRTGAGA